jgi:hypothetical protein
MRDVMITVGEFDPGHAEKDRIPNPPRSTLCIRNEIRLPRKRVQVIP